MGEGEPANQEPSRLDDMRYEKVEPIRPGWQVFLFVWATGFLLPRRFAYWSRWPSRLRGKQLAAYLAYKVGQGIAIRYWVVPAMRRYARKQERVVAELSEQLGREPTSEEVSDYWGER